MYERDANTGLLKQQYDIDASEGYKMFWSVKLWKNTIFALPSLWSYHSENVDELYFQQSSN